MSTEPKLGKRRTRARRNDGYSVYKHRSGRWEWMVTVGYFENGTQERIRGYAATRDDAVAAAQAVAHRKRSGGWVPTGEDASVAEYLDQWLDLRIKPHREPKTTSFYSGNIKNHIVPAIGKVQLRKLTAQHVQKLVNDLLAKGKSASTSHGVLRTIRTALSTAWREGLVEQNVAQRVTMPRLVHREPDHLSPEEAQALLLAVKGHTLQNLVRFALATGTRVGEATGLTWDRVDVDKQEVSLCQQLQRIDGKLLLKSLKSRSSKRTLALSETALQALQDANGARLVFDATLDGGYNPQNLVFLNSEGRPLDPKYVHQHLKKACVIAGIRPISFHKLRHTAATLMVAAGVELHQVKEQLGHSQIALTANLYAHRVTEAQRKAVNKLDDVLRSGQLPE